MPVLPVIPESVTVHLGPASSDAQNVTVSFPDYIKNVASSEIYPTWPENAIRANIYAQISFALNRIYTEYYRSRGYNFDITNSTATDQSFVWGRDIFENISRIVDEIFTDYISRQGAVEPLFAQYCDGDEVQCAGLSQWGTVELANSGYTPYEILQYYYGDNIDIVRDTPVAAIRESVPPTSLRVGSYGDDVKQIQIRLNRIGKNYPSIPKIPVANGYYTTTTADAVRRFQEIFNLTPDGIVGRATWYKIQLVYNSVKRLADLNSEGLALADVTREYSGSLRRGDTGYGVRTLQYFLDFIAFYNDAIPPVDIDGIFGAQTEEAVRAYQREYGLVQDGIVGENTWYSMQDAYRGIYESIPAEYFENHPAPFGGDILFLGVTNPQVRLLQQYLNYISQTYPQIPRVEETGYFGTRTQEAVTAFQRQFGLEPNGVVGPIAWYRISGLYDDLYSGSGIGEGQYYPITGGE